MEGPAIQPPTRHSSIGRKSATMVGRTAFLSPAMYHLYLHAESGEERIRLLKNIPVYVIGSKEIIPNMKECANVNG
jgi:hypothetical protein